MDLGLKDKPALVMASSEGLGLGTAIELAREGAKVMLFSRSEDKLRSAQKSIEEETGNRPEYVAGSVSDPADIENAVKATVEKFGGIWALFNNTGGPPAGAFETLHEKAWQAAFELTLLSYVRAIRLVLPHMRSRGGGRIVNNTSGSTKQAIDNLILSNTFRLGIVGMTKSIARELGSQKILVNTVGPGRIDTGRVAQLDTMWATQRSISYEEMRASSESAIPLKRYGDIREFGRVAAFLCSEANSYLTGQNILIDGGMVEAY